LLPDNAKFIAVRLVWTLLFLFIWLGASWSGRLERLFPRILGR